MFSLQIKGQAESTCKDFVKVADAFGLKPGVKISVDEAASQANKAVLSMSPEEVIALVLATHGMLFVIIDTNKNGTVSQKEFKVYLNRSSLQIFPKQTLFNP